jgi:hypothetical protein
VLGYAILYAVRRATSTAVENVERKAAWAAAASAFLLCALISALIVAYQFLEPRVGTVHAVALISVACLLIGLICLLLPGMIERAERQGAQAPAQPRQLQPRLRPSMRRRSRPSTISGRYGWSARPSSLVSEPPAS